MVEVMAVFLVAVAGSGTYTLHTNIALAINRVGINAIVALPLETTSL